MLVWIVAVQCCSVVVSKFQTSKLVFVASRTARHGFRCLVFLSSLVARDRLFSFFAIALCLPLQLLLFCAPRCLFFQFWTILFRYRSFNCAVWSPLARWAMVLSQEIRWLGIDVLVDVGGQGNLIRQCGFGYQADRRLVQLFRLTSWLSFSGTSRSRGQHACSFLQHGA